MPKYHDSGTVCRATERPCPLGLSDGDHIEAADEKDFEKKLAEKMKCSFKTVGELLENPSHGLTKLELNGETAEIVFNGERLFQLYTGSATNEEEAQNLLKGAVLDFDPSEAFLGTEEGVYGGPGSYAELLKYRTASADLKTALKLPTGEAAYSPPKVPKMKFFSLEDVATEEKIEGFLKSAGLYDGELCFTSRDGAGNIWVNFQAPRGTALSARLDVGSTMGEFYSLFAEKVSSNTAASAFDSAWRTPFANDLPAVEYAKELEEDERLLKEIANEVDKRRGLL